MWGSGLPWSLVCASRPLCASPFPTSTAPLKTGHMLSDFTACYHCSPLGHPPWFLFHPLSLRHCLCHYPGLSFDTGHHNLLETFYLLGNHALLVLLKSLSSWLDSPHLPNFPNLTCPLDSPKPSFLLPSTTLDDYIHIQRFKYDLNADEHFLSVYCVLGVILSALQI